MRIRHGRYLRQVGDADDLVAPCYEHELLRYLLGGSPADTSIYLVKNQCGDIIGIRQHSFDSQHDSGKLSS